MSVEILMSLLSIFQPKMIYMIQRRSLFWTGNVHMFSSLGVIDPVLISPYGAIGHEVCQPWSKGAHASL